MNMLTMPAQAPSIVTNPTFGIFRGAEKVEEAVGHTAADRLARHMTVTTGELHTIRPL